MLYASILIFLLLLSYHFDYQKHTRYRLFWYLVVLIVFILISGLRYRLGVDSTRYEYQYYDLPPLWQLTSYNSESSRFGIGYILFNSIARCFSDSFVMMQILHAIFVNTILFYFFYKNTRKIFLCILLYAISTYFNYNFEILRESCAVMVFLLAWKYFKANRWLKYYFICIVAILFHPSAIVTLLFPIFYHQPFRQCFLFNWKFTICAAGVFVLSMILSAKFFDMLQLITLASVEEYSKIYQNSELSGGRLFNLLGLTIYSLRYLLYPIICGIFLRAEQKSNRRQTNRNTISTSLEYMIGWYFYIALITIFIQIFYRFNNYLLPFLILALTKFSFSKIKTKHSVKKLSFGLSYTIILPYFLVFAITYMSNDSDSGLPLFTRYYPYSTILNPQKNEKREQLFRYLGGA